MKKTQLLTGVAGFIGQRTALNLLERGDFVLGVDNLNDYYDVRFKELRLKQLQSFPNFVFCKMDIEDRAALNALFDEYKFDSVFNLAARAGVRYSMENPFVYMTTNAMGSLNLLDAMCAHGVKKFLLASTSSLYAGQIAPFTEDMPVNTPLSPYAASKKAAEAMAYSYHHLYGIDVSILRYFTVFGPFGRPDMSIYRFIKWIDEGTPIELFGDGTQSRDFTYVDDVVSGTVAAEKPLGFEVINLGGGRNPVNMNQIIAWLEEMLGKKASRIEKPFHCADVRDTWANTSKARRLLGWSPRVDLKQGLEHCVRWYLDNKETLKAIPI